MARAPAGSFWTVVGVFVLFGPPLGGLAVVVHLTVSGGFIDPGLVATLVMASHIGGILPAIATGLSVAAISSRLDSRFLWLLSAALFGAGYSALILGQTYFLPVGGFAGFGGVVVSSRSPSLEIGAA